MHHIHERYCARRQCCRQKLSSIKLVYFCSYSLSKMGDYVQYILTGFMSSEIQSFNCSLALSIFFFLNSKYVFFFIYCSFPKKTFWLAVVPKSGPNTSSGTITKSVTHSYRDDSLVSFYDHYFCCCGCLLLLLDYNAFHSIKKKSVCWFVKCLLYLLLMKFQQPNHVSKFQVLQVIFIIMQFFQLDTFMMSTSKYFPS